MLQLHRDCAQLAGAATALSAASAAPLGPPTLVLPPRLGGATALAPLAAPLQSLVRRLLAHKQLAAQQGRGALVFEVRCGWLRHARMHCAWWRVLPVWRRGGGVAGCAPSWLMNGLLPPPLLRPLLGRALCSVIQRAWR